MIRVPLMLDQGMADGAMPWMSGWKLPRPKPKGAVRPKVDVKTEHIGMKLLRGVWTMFHAMVHQP